MRPLLTSEGLRLLGTIDAIAHDHHVRAATIALAWLMHQPTVTAPLASATSHEQLEELLAAPTVTLDQAEITRLNAAADDLT